MKQVSSAAMTLAVRAGAACDLSGSEGSGAVACEWCLRGAGERNTRQLNDALDSLGCHHHESVRSEHLVFYASQFGRNLSKVLAIYADVLRRPRLTDEDFEPSRALTLQDLASLEDEPARKCNVLLRERFYPHPLGKCTQGNAESLQELTPESVRGHVRERFIPRGAIIAVAGNLDWDEFRDLVIKHFGDWSGGSGLDVKISPARGGVAHLQKDSAQTHIALAHRSVPLGNEQYYAARMAETILSGGMSSRLFTEVRERRGLAYHVSTHYHSLKNHAGMFTYAGTTPDKAQQTFDLIVRELRRLSEGIQQCEIDAGRTQLKSGLIMQGESTESRSGALVSDWYHLRRLRTLQELSDAIDNTTIDDIMAYLSKCPAENFTILTVGPEPLDIGIASDSEQ